MKACLGSKDGFVLYTVAGESGICLQCENIAPGSLCLGVFSVSVLAHE